MSLYRSIKSEKIAVGYAIAQGVLETYGITKDDSASGIRNGDFGSMDK